MHNTHYLNGDVCRPGKVEVPAGMTIREIIEQLGGGMTGKKSCKAVQIGGASGGLLTADQLEIPLDFKTLQGYGIRRGDSTINVFDSDRCIVDITYRYMAQTQNDFCGKCVPCREGTKRIVELLSDLCEFRLDQSGFSLMRELGEMIHITALCSLGKNSCMTLRSALEHFPEEFEAHLSGYCPLCSADAHKPFASCSLPYYKKVIRIDSELCRGCSKCSRSCHVGAISGQVRSPFHIDSEKCAHCYTCIDICPFGAIEEVEIDG